jgi:hypothetical protein
MNTLAILLAATLLMTSTLAVMTPAPAYACRSDFCVPKGK